MKQHRPRVSEENYTKLERYTGDNFDDRLGSLLLLKSFREQELDNLRADKKMFESRLSSVKTNIVFSLVIVLLLIIFLVTQ